MTTYYVATLARYVLVEASDEHEAQQLAVDALRQLAPEDLVRLQTIRPATSGEISLWQWHQRMLAAENEE